MWGGQQYCLLLLLQVSGRCPLNHRREQRSPARAALLLPSTCRGYPMITMFQYFIVNL